MVRRVRGHLLVGLAACRPVRRRARGRGGADREPARQPGRRGGARGAADSVAQLPLPGLDGRVDLHRGPVRDVRASRPSPMPRPLGGGVNLFAGGPGGATSAATQVVDVSGAAAEIDAGQAGGDALRAARRLLGADRPRRGHRDLPERRGRAGAVRSPSPPSPRPIATSRPRSSPGRPRGRCRRAPARSRFASTPSATRAPTTTATSTTSASCWAPERAGCRSSTRPSWSRRSAARSACGGRAASSSSNSRAPTGSRSARRSTPWREWWSSPRWPRRAARRRSAKFYEGVFKVTQTGLGHEPRAHRAAGLVSRRRPQRGGDEEEAAPPLGRRQGLVPHDRQVQLRHRPRHEVARQGQLRRHPDPRRARDGHGPRQGARTKTVVVAAGKSYLAKP